MNLNALRRDNQGRGLAALGFVLGLWLGATSVSAAQITVFAAASLTDALKEIGQLYEQQSSRKVVFNFAASSVLARQIEEGAPADVFFSADAAMMDVLDSKGLLLAGTRTNLLSNSLVIVTTPDSGATIRTPADLAGPAIKRIALADPRAVPAGVYSRKYLEAHHLWTAVEPKVVPTENVRAALAAVESGNVDAGMIFKTDAAISKRVKVACEIPRAEGPTIIYPAAVIRESNRIEAARHFLQYLSSNAAKTVFEKYGFIALK